MCIKNKMAALLLIGIATIVCKGQSQCLPRVPIMQPQPVANTPVVASTVIDNSVSNALANAIQLLIVSNLIENTMGCPKTSPCPTQPVEICPTEVINSIPCDRPYITACDQIDIIPNVCYTDTVPIIPNVGCDYHNYIPNIGSDFSSYIPNVGCEYPNYLTGCDCSNCVPKISCDCQNYIHNIGCDCPSYVPRISCDYPNYIPNIGCDCPNNVANVGCDCPNYIPNIGYDYPNVMANSISCNCPGYYYPNPYPCDQYVSPIAAEIVLPQAIPAQLSCNFGCMPNIPILSMNVEPWSNFIEPCGCGCKPYNNGIYF